MPLGFDGGKTIVDDYLREIRPLFAPPPRTFQRTVYRPGEVCQFDLWEPRVDIPVGPAEPPPTPTVDEIRRHDRPGGLIHEYYRAAA